MANITPATVSKTKAKSPSPIIIIVCALTKASARILKEIVSPKNKVIRLASVLCAASDRLFNTPHSRRRFPNIRKPTKDTEVGATIPTINVTTTGKAIRSPFETFAGLYVIGIHRSFLVVTSLMAAGCTIGTSAI